MNERVEKEIRDQFEYIKKLKLAVGEINNHLSALEQLGKDTKENVYQKGCEEGYANGYKKGIEDGKACDENVCKGCKWENKDGYEEPCKHCCNAYLNQYAPMPKLDDPIEVGDEVRQVTDSGTVTGLLCTVTSYDGDRIGGFSQDGRVIVCSSQANRWWKKTGRHHDIDLILEAMKNV